jgi:hypothetical protein
MIFGLFGGAQANSFNAMPMKIVTTLLAGLLSLLFGCDSKAPYEKRNGVWHFDGHEMHIAQPEQFKPLLGPFAKGAEGGYYRGSAIADSNGASFEAMDEHYARDKLRVYYCDTYRKSQEYYSMKHDRIVVLEGVEAASFRLLKNSYARDTNKLFFDGVYMPVKDLNSFEILEYSYARDHVTGYFLQQPVPGSDGSTFIGIDSHYAKDKASVFYSFYDSNARLPRTVRLVGASPESFIAKDGGYATDARQAYHDGKVLTKDAANFQVLQFGYAKSSNAVYYQGQAIAGADAATFAMQSPNEQADARDAQASYLQGKRTPAAQAKAAGA